MSNFNVEFPYQIGTYLSKDENGLTHIDQLHEYILDKNGISVRLMLDVFKNPRLSIKIGMNDLLSNWTEVEKTDVKVHSKRKK